MKKIVALMLAAALLLLSVSAVAEIKIGQVDYAAHGTKCFAVLTVAVDGDTIVAAKIDEFQVMAADANVGVPNSDAMFPALAENNQVLGSKRVNNGTYSTNMTNHAGATLPLGVGYNSIEAFVTGKTIAELEAMIAEKSAAEMVDAVSSCTLADTLGYVSGLVAAAKAASLATGYYTVYNKTGETATEVYVINLVTGEKTVKLVDMAADAVAVITYEATPETHLIFGFVTESGYEAHFDNLAIETAPITMLAADAMTGATPISFFAPAAE